MKRLAFLGAVACLWGCVLTGTGRAGLINVDFNQTGSPSGTYSGAAVLGASGDIWNGVPGANPDTAARLNLPLVTSSGAASSVTLSFSGQSGFFDVGGSSNAIFNGTSHDALMDDYVFTHGIVTASFTGLTPGGSYELILYSAANDTTRQTVFTVNGSSQTVQDSTGSATLTLGSTYADFITTADASGKLSFTVTPGPNSSGNEGEGNLDGIQLQSLAAATAPEPTSLTLLSLGSFGLLGYCRRRRKA